jgi:hypothetical protein
MKTDLQSVADEQAIINLASRYCWALDTRDFADLENVFMPDAFAFLGETECDGIGAIIERVSSALTRLDASQHLVGSHFVALDGDEATHRCYLQAQHVLRGTEGGDLFLVAGMYADRAVRTLGGWRIKHRVLTRIWTSGNPMVVAPDIRPKP